MPLTMSCLKTSNLVLDACLVKMKQNSKSNVVHEQKQNTFVEMCGNWKEKKFPVECWVVDESHWISDLNPFSCCFQYWNSSFHILTIDRLISTTFFFFLFTFIFSHLHFIFYNLYLIQYMSNILCVQCNIYTIQNRNSSNISQVSWFENCTEKKTKKRISFTTYLSSHK